MHLGEQIPVNMQTPLFLKRNSFAIMLRFSKQPEDNGSKLALSSVSVTPVILVRCRCLMDRQILLPHVCCFALIIVRAPG